MSECDLDKQVSKFEKYVAEVKKSETPEQSRVALIRTGILTKNGNVKSEYRRVFK